MSHDWIREYNILADFISIHPEIKIGANRTHIPENIRSEFYDLFNAVRLSFIENLNPDIYNKATILSQNYLEVKKEVTDLLSLENISAEGSLSEFLQNPSKHLMTELFNSLYDLLIGRLDIKSFEERSINAIEATFNSHYLSGYKIWVALSIIKLLEPTKLMRVVLPELIEGSGRDLREFLNTPKMHMPPPTESKQIFFRQSLVRQPWPSNFIVPDLIVYSGLLNSYLSVRLEMGKAISHAPSFNQNREWRSFKPVLAFNPSFILIYIADSPEEISLIADTMNICKPDLLIECDTHGYITQREQLNEFGLHQEAFQPKLGTYAISEKHLSENLLSTIKTELGDKNRDMHIFNVGFDQIKLTPVIKALCTAQPSEKK